MTNYSLLVAMGGRASEDRSGVRERPMVTDITWLRDRRAPALCGWRGPSAGPQIAPLLRDLGWEARVQGREERPLQPMRSTTSSAETRNCAGGLDAGLKARTTRATTTLWIEPLSNLNRKNLPAARATGSRFPNPSRPRRLFKRLSSL